MISNVSLIEAIGVLTMLKTKDVPYVYSRDGIYYFTRRIPKDLRGHYRCPRIVVSLRTKSAQAAIVIQFYGFLNL